MRGEVTTPLHFASCPALAPVVAYQCSCSLSQSCHLLSILNFLKTNMGINGIVSWAAGSSWVGTSPIGRKLARCSARLQSKIGVVNALSTAQPAIIQQSPWDMRGLQINGSIHSHETHVSPHKTYLHAQAPSGRMCWQYTADACWLIAGHVSFTQFLCTCISCSLSRLPAHGPHLSPLPRVCSLLRSSYVDTVRCGSLSTEREVLLPISHFR